jgi:hypothetical protein
MEAEALAERFEIGWWYAELHHCTDSAVCFSRLLVLRRRKLTLRFAKPSESQSSRRQFHLTKWTEATYAEYLGQKASASGWHGFRLSLW